MRTLVCLTCAVVMLASAADAEDIADSGFNEDVVTEIGTPGYAHRFDIWGASWIENGVTSGSITGIGLPASGVIVSATSSGVTYHLRPYDANNVLRMGDNDPFTGTMAVTPGQYSTLHILAASGTAGGPASVLKQTSDITLNFADGSVVLPNALLAHDWDAVDNPRPPNSVAIGGMDRNVIVGSTSADGWSGQDTRHHFALYETALDLSTPGLSRRVLDSITFSDTTVDQATGVFAVDGTLVPEPAALGLFAAAGMLLLARRHRGDLRFNIKSHGFSNEIGPQHVESYAQRHRKPGRLVRHREPGRLVLS